MIESNSKVEPKQPGLIGRYQYLGEMGMGSMADVIKAYDPRIGRILAIKLIRHQYSNDENYKKLFLQEARSVGNLSHPNIVTIYDVGEFQGKPYLAMELLTGLTLEQQMQQSPINSIEEIVDIALQATEGLGYAHNNGIIHGDIKAANLIYNQDTGLIKILDFGIAHFDNAHQEKSSENQTVAGTPEYMAPEQLLGVSTDLRADLYSLGVLFYFLLTGKLPFQADDNDELFKQIVSGKLAVIKPRVNDTPKVFIDLIRKLLSKNIESRVQSSAELLESLKEVQYQLLQNKKQKNKNKFIPLRFKWTFIMVSVVALVMSVGLFTVNYLQYKAMTNIVFDYGGSLMKMVAVESAENLLIEDYVGVQTLVDELERQQTFLFMSIADRHNIVRGSSDHQKVNKIYTDNQISHILYQDEFIRVSDGSTTKQDLIFKFSSPIYYRDKLVGQAYLGLEQDALNSASSATLWMMVSLMVVTLLTVLLGIYLLTYRLTQPLLMLSRVLDKVFSGNYTTRIPVRGNDELSLVYRSYNRMVEVLDKSACEESEQTSNDKLKLVEKNSTDE